MAAARSERGGTRQRDGSCGARRAAAAASRPTHRAASRGRLRTVCGQPLLPPADPARARGIPASRARLAHVIRLRHPGRLRTRPVRPCAAGRRGRPQTVGPGRPPPQPVVGAHRRGRRQLRCGDAVLVPLAAGCGGRPTGPAARGSPRRSSSPPPSGPGSRSASGTSHGSSATTATGTARRTAPIQRTRASTF